MTMYSRLNSERTEKIVDKIITASTDITIINVDIYINITKYN